MGNEKVSAIVTTYKRQPEIVIRAIKSIINQTYKNIEIIVVDDSPDSFADRPSIEAAVRSLDSNIMFIKHKTNQGACAARNTGLRHSSGNYIAYLDDDDEWMPNKIKKQLELMHSKNIALVYCNSMFVDDNTGKSVEGIHAKHKGFIYDELIKENFIGSTSFPLIRKECMDAIGGFDIKMESAQDHDVWLRLCKKYEVDCISEPLVIYHVHEGEQISKNPEKKINGLKRLNEKNSEYLNHHRDALWIRELKIVPFYSLNGQMKKGVIEWVKAARIRPFRLKTNLMYLARLVLKKP